MAIHGVAYGRSASLEVAGDTLRWRAQRGLPAVAENIVTTIHDVRLARWIVRRHSWAGLILAALGVLSILRDGALVGACALAGGAALLGWRLASPRRLLVLELAGMQLVLVVGARSASAARELAARIDQAIANNEVPSEPPMLP